jgi:hypothetical protein
MGKKGKKAQAGKPKKLTPKDIGKRLDALVKKCEEELKGADLFAPLPPTEDCAICLVPLSRVHSGTCYQACCGKDICKACYKQNEESINKQNEKNADKKDKKQSSLLVHSAANLTRLASMRSMSRFKQGVCKMITMHFQ